MGNTEEDGTIHVPEFRLPRSGFLTTETILALERQAQADKALAKACPYAPTILASAAETIAFRQCLDKHFYPPLIARHRALYDVHSHPKLIAGVSTEVFTPTHGIPVDRRDHVLVNLHGGGFVIGGRAAGQIDSIPIAAVGKIKVVSVDYRMAPEYRFPVATEDVVKVYQALLQDYSPRNIGIYGSSAGALLTAQTVAWLQRAGVPLPGAIGMFFGGGGYFGEGDAGHYYAARSGVPLAHVTSARENPYFSHTDDDDPLAFPVRSREIMARFPPSLLVSATRDFALSSVVQMHSSLVDAGIEARLHVWEGLDHDFHVYPELPQSRRLYEVAVKFFAEHLRA
jgi:acetyl esterase/lipase